MPSSDIEKGSSHVVEHYVKNESESEPFVGGSGGGQCGDGEAALESNELAVGSGAERTGSFSCGHSQGDKSGSNALESRFGSMSQRRVVHMFEENLESRVKRDPGATNSGDLIKRDLLVQDRWERRKSLQSGNSTLLGTQANADSEAGTNLNADVAAPNLTRLSRSTHVASDPQAPGAFPSGLSAASLFSSDGDVPAFDSAHLSLGEEGTSGNDQLQSPLAVANPVSGDSHQFSLPQAKELDQSEVSERLSQTENQRAYKTRAVMALLIIAVLIIIAVLVTVIALVFTRQDSDNVSPSSSKNTPTQPPEAMSIESYIQGLLPPDTLKAIEEPGSSQSQAYHWLLADSHLTNRTETSVVQRFALATIYYAMRGDLWWQNQNWLSYEHHECDWSTGKTADTLDLLADWAGSESSPMIQGLLAVTSFPCDVENVLYKHFGFDIVGLVGTIPEELYLLSNLETVAILGAQIDGTSLSTNIGKLTSLQYFGVGNSGLKGSIPTQIGMLSDLVSIGLSGNTITGTIPTQMGLLTNLQEISFFQNQLTGSIPTEIGSMPELSMMYFFLNLLSGTTPTEIGFLSHGLEIAFEYNQLTGSMPSELGLMTALSHLDFSSNQLTGTIPSQLGQLPDLEALVLTRNVLTGSLPTELNQVAASGSLLALHLAKNSLTGTISDDFCQLNDNNNKDCPLSPFFVCAVTFDCTESLCGCDDCPCPA